MNNTSKSQNLKARYYLYRVAGKKFNEGKKYEQTKSILIMFNNYKNEYIKDLKVANYSLNDQRNDIKLEDINIYEIYLLNYKNVCYDNLSRTEKKIYLFNCESYEEMEKLNLEEEDKYIVSELRRLSMSERFIDDYDTEKVNQMLMTSEHESGYEQGVERGIEQGSKETAINIAKSLLKSDMSMEEIAQHTNLTLDEIITIKEKM